MPETKHTKIDLAVITLPQGETKTLDVDLYLPPLHLAGQDYVFVPPAVPARVAITFVGQGYTINMRFSCRLEGACWRCLEPADIDLDVSVDDFFETELPPIEELGESDEPSLWYEEDGILDLSEWAHDAVAEILPAKILCDPQCRGLCAQCGANLNLGECGCEPPADMRWEKLKDLKGD